MVEVFEQKHFCETTTGIQKNGLDFICLMKCLAYFARFYEYKKFFDSMASVLSRFYLIPE